MEGPDDVGPDGNEQVTTQNLVVVKADPERELLLVRGAVPGPKGGTVVVRSAARGGLNGSNKAGSNKGGAK